MAALALKRVRSENRLLLHLAFWVVASLFLAVLNFLTTGPRPPWSLVPIAVLALLLACHWLAVGLILRRRYALRHLTLVDELRSALARRPSDRVEELERLRSDVLRSTREAREALGPSSPELAAALARGEDHALSLIAWLDEAEERLGWSRRDKDLRLMVAHQLSHPGGEGQRAALRQLLARLDRQDSIAAAVAGEADSRRSLLESFLLAIESAGLAESSEALLSAVQGPVQERIELLEEIVGAPPPVVGGPRPVSEPDKSRIRRQVEMARELQSSILPRHAPEVPGLMVAHLYRPSSEVGGDFYDFYARASGRLLAAVGDASGHGLDSSMVSSMAKSALYTQVSGGRELDEIMGELNRLMCDTLGRRRLMTLALIEVDTESRTLSWVGAGHAFPLLRRDDRVIELAQASYPLGIRRDTRFEVRRERLEPGDVVLLYTDGYVEATDSDGEPFGYDRLAAIVGETGAQTPRELLDRLIERLSAHLGPLPAEDDVTLVTLLFQP